LRGLGGVTLQGGGFRLLIVVEKICTRDAKSKCLYREFLGGAETKKTRLKRDCDVNMLSTSY